MNPEYNIYPKDYSAAAAGKQRYAFLEAPRYHHL
jgi:hypothetical protein